MDHEWNGWTNGKEKYEINAVIDHLLAEENAAQNAGDGEEKKDSNKNDSKNRDFTQEQREFLHKVALQVASNQRVIAKFSRKFPQCRKPSSSLVSQYRRKPAPPEGQSGRREILEGREPQLLNYALARLRSKAVPLSARYVAAVGRGIVERERPGSTVLQGGSTKLTTSWARQYMKQHGYAFLAATTDRTVSPGEALPICEKWLDEVADIVKAKNVPRELLFNVDELFVTLGGEQGKRKTWNKRSAAPGRNGIAVRSTRPGVTASVCTSADGGTLLLHVIHKGTSRKAVGLPDDQAVLQSFRPTSHFQDAQTWEEWLHAFKDKVTEKKQALGLEDQMGLLLVDAAPQHSLEVSGRVLAGVCAVACLPPRMTHYLQPADQFIIPALRARTKSLLDDSMATAFAKKGVRAAVDDAATLSAPIVRARKIMCMTQAWQEMGKSVVTRSWEKTGILRSAYGESPPKNFKVNVDVLRENKVVCDEFPVDMSYFDDIIDDAGMVEGDTDDADDDDEAADAVPRPAKRPRPPTQASPTQANPTQANSVPAKRRKLNPTAPDFVLIPRRGRPPLRLLPKTAADLKNEHLNSVRLIRRKRQAKSLFMGSRKAALYDID